jgi:hypothetical protein
MIKWRSKNNYTHPKQSIPGYIVRNSMGVFAFRSDLGTLSCSQEWAAKIYAQEHFNIRLGRPPIGSDTLPAIRVPEQLRVSLLKKALELGLSFPDSRREAYRKFIQ